MAQTTTTTLANLYQNHYSRKLLERAEQMLRLQDFAEMADLPRNTGSKSVRFIRPRTSSASDVQTLTEGTSPAARTTINFETLDATLALYGEVAEFTDIASWTSLIDVMRVGIEVMAGNAALKADDITRGEIVANASNRFPGAVGAATFAALAGASVPAGKITTNDVLDTVTKLKQQRAPTFGGYYAAVLAPEVTRDLQLDNAWVTVSQYADAERIFRGEVGRYFGARVVEATNPFRESAVQGTYDGAGTIYSSIFTGMGGYGVPRLSGQSPWRPRVLICNDPDKSDPLNQKITVGWKAFYTAKVLNPGWVINLRTRSQFNG